MQLLTTATLVAVTIVTHAGSLYFVPKSGESAVMCPDKTHECPTGNTCCLLSDMKTYGCCPSPNAVCCLDKKYCCPAGSKCVVGRLGYCSRTNYMFPWLQHVKAKLIATKNEPNIIIEDISAKSDANRILAHMDEWKMKEHTETNRVLDHSAHEIIIDDISAKSDANRILAQKQNKIVSFYKCPDGKTECGVGQTCCPGLAGDFCCELPDAVCCPDKIACCPYGYTCNPNTPGNCDNGTAVNIHKSDNIVEWSVNVPAATSVMCPDGKSECDDNDTCCPMDGGKYGCCPTPDANCCSDHKHCCPTGYKCDLLKQACVSSQGNQLRWLKTKPHHGFKNSRSKQEKSEPFHELELPTINHQPSHADIVCPDSKITCTSTQTCCKLTNGNYGCCPTPKAVCCSDEKHCCPEGTKCDVSSGKCNLEDLTAIDWLEKVPAVNTVCPGGQFECPTGQTCCKQPSGSYGCCPLPDAVCCSDGVHCCPSGTTCDLSAGTCKQGDLTMVDWLEKVPAVNAGIECPDKQSRCASGQTCCKLPSGNYGCCPQPNAVCCSDGVHCCPSGTTCDLSAGTCKRGDLTMVDWLEKVPTVNAGIECPDKQSECASGQTCCKLPSGNYGCCPKPNAVCCTDGKHCCPEGTTCDLSTGKCNRRDLTAIDWLEKVPALKAAIECPDRQSKCKSGQTCCKLPSGNYGCCPIPKAVCCSDGKHCCPEGTTCDLSTGKCNRGDFTAIDWLEKVPAKNTVCPGGQFECPTGQTCCKQSSGSYGCCPLPDAVCCSDGVHCCPSGTTCDVSAGTCTKGGLTMINWLEKVPAVSAGIECPDKESQCASGQTCCKLPSGNYGCCPKPNAVCCSDGVHCCPSGTTCDLSAGKCIGGGLPLINWLEKVPTVNAGIECPDKQSQCASGQTCCKLPSGNYGCCPKPNAVCCSDGVHCCSSGTTCDLSAGKCIGGGLTLINWLEKVPAVNAGIECPDKQSQCASGQTCCKLPSGNYGCCPKPNAVCCSDGVHCCPSGTTCDLSAGKCMGGGLTLINWLEKVPAVNAGIECPDKQSQCASGQTCCKLPSGNYGCCPKPNAVCCSDGVHCCPNGDTCDLSAGKCIKGDLTAIDWLEKVPALNTQVKCPDGHSECKSGQTCCKLKNGNYGCCPQPNAVCCSDGVHCCPSGTTCDLSSGKCMRRDLTAIEWLEKVPAINTQVECPDGKSECKSGQTCCKLKNGHYGCCPQPKAVCCSDGVHCCPSGTTCDVSSGKCMRRDLTAIEWLEKVPAINTQVECPDGKSECKSGQTCCKLKNGHYGCCPQPKAVCCSDGVHCCPSGTTCDVSSGKCMRRDLTSIEWLKKVPAINTQVECPDGKSECKSGQTCCKLKNGHYGCCPQPKAVCCSDGVHCCPSGTTCDVSSGKCMRRDLTAIEWLEKVPAINTQVECPDGKSECKSGQTCCKLKNGHYGCCPQPKAVCCSDGVHCCPSGTTCDVSSGKCMRRDLTAIEWLEKVPAINTQVECPDGKSECKSGQTCCKLKNGHYGCCPQPKAVCCSDGVHCCPSGTTCDVSSGKCMRRDLTSIEWLKKVPAINTQVECPDGKSECKSGQTCCKLKNGHYGCCPQPKAVCCSDGVHCCPSGTTCDVSSGKCMRRDLTAIEWLEKVPAINTQVECPDGKSECKSGQTCCKLKNGHYGCCPQPKAVCCSDGVHCCPSGTTCDVSSGKCMRRDLTSIEWLKKVPAINTQVECPDGKSECKSGQTCCKLKNGHYGCCPQPKAVCCSDGVHCCPSGTTCDVSSGKCMRRDLTSIEWLKKVPAINTQVECPDGKSECKSGQTCCKLKNGHYGCCPQPKAVCCSDGVHCCPSGTTCDVSSGKCMRRDLTSIEWLKKVPAINTQVECPDGKSECKSGQTCCKLKNGHYGCCPQPKAVCCSDGVHCCPSGTTCDVSSGKCMRRDLTAIEWLEKVPAVNTQVECPDGKSECKSGQTCCKLKNGHYGCCPQPKAVCCSDGVHCCPSGTTCDVSSGKCMRRDLTAIEWLEKVPAINTQVECPDGKSECKSGQTCCKLKNGHYGCCPQPKAVCCSDGVHCCPSGTTCDVSSGKCMRRDLTAIEWLEKVPAVNTQVECPDGKSECKSGQTCCKLKNGHYGCCPQPKAVCCSDGVHCCPSGTTCDVSSGKCMRRDLTAIEWLEKVPAINTQVECPDGKSECKSGQTCCKLKNGHYGCCPEPKAVCCSDGVHCCPSGTTCDVSSGKCMRRDLTAIEWLEKVPAINTQVECPDGKSECKSGQTCCKLKNGHYGCCPEPKAVCCSDGVHCCPSGTTCDVSSGKCMRRDLTSIEWLEKVPAINTQVECPDGKSECKSGQTCCKLKNGHYGCCPEPKAVCCSDGVHCCPSGTTCDVSSGKCMRRDLTAIEWLEKVPAINTQVECPDGKSECKSGQTCCKLKNGHYGCCPEPKAVCCSDGVHCCPNGTTCDVSSGKCMRRDLTAIDWLEKVPAINTQVKCPDGKSECKSSQTCCKLKNGNYGCCPQPKAVCCSDGVHCCPEGYTCDVSGGKCEKQSKIPFIRFSKITADDDTTLSSIRLSKIEADDTTIVCPDQTSTCRNGQTCCKQKDSRYACCPLPEAVCCEDNLHCCPHNTTCNMGKSTCDDVLNGLSRPLVSKVPAGKLPAPCKGQEEDCTTGVCCEIMGTGNYSCCPYNNGVCCKNSKYCCPHTYVCDEGPGICRIPFGLVNMSKPFKGKPLQ